MTKLTKLADLASDPRNPRRISEKAASGLGYSMAEFGDLSGITYNQRTGELVCGHQRVKSLRERYGDLSIEGGTIRTPEGHEFAVRVVDWPRSKQHAANVVANSPTIQGEFTEDLDELLREVEADSPDLFAELDLEQLLGGVEPEQPEIETAGDQTDRLKSLWGVVVECGSEDEQALLFERFTEEGLKCRLLIS